MLLRVCLSVCLSVCLGVTNTVTALQNAQLAESPVLLLGGAAASLLRGRGALQDVDQLTLVKSLCKFSTRLHRLRDIHTTLTRAIHIAVSQTPGTGVTHTHLDYLLSVPVSGVAR